MLRRDGQSFVVTQLQQLLPLRYEDGSLTMGVDDLFFRDWVEDHFGHLLVTAVERASGRTAKLAWEKIERAQARASLPSAPPVNQLRHTVRLNDKFTFESYVVSEANQLPAAAAHAVAENPGRAYNPLFIYGETGLGKTHLLHAIANRVLARNPHFRVTYLSSEEFTNQYIESVRDQRMPEFRRRFRDECDVLLIDDIQFLGKKQETQNEFFYTFNALHQLGKAVVMTSDTVPSEIPGLEDRLRSRFAMGLITDVHEPTFEARVAILKKKATQDGIAITDKVAHFIARVVVNNVRELEGALIRVIAVHALTGQPLTEELCATVLGDMMPEKVTLDAEMIQKEVARFYKLNVDDLRGERRMKPVAHARQVAMYLVRTLTTSSLPEIGKKFNKDHSTVLASVRKIENARGNDSQLQLDLGELTKKLVPTV
ncbi:MAG: chromosomal replication initiator protein DnaA [Myxococcales bacterium]|nr:chromosomal replication initiator protein DnaA [Myxococcales bacterium]MDP3506147.1 chromosomal replication initiator protein DnaA [Myxococcales bacterium]